MVAMSDQEPAFLPLSERQSAFLKDLLFECLETIKSHRDPEEEQDEGSDDPDDATLDDASVIIGSLPRLIPGARLSITCTSRYDPSSNGNLMFRSTSFDLTDEVICSAANTYDTEHNSSDTSSTVMFECRTDGFSEGDLSEWIDFAWATSGSTISVNVDLPSIEEAEGHTAPHMTHDEEPTWPFDDSAFDPKKPRVKAQQLCGLLPTAVERAKDNAMLVSALLEASMNSVVDERYRVKSLSAAPFTCSLLFGIIAALTYILGGNPGWAVPALASIISGAMAAERAAGVRGLDLAITNIEERFRQHGVDVTWHPSRNRSKAIVQWKALELSQKYEVMVSTDPNFTKL